MQNSRNLEEAIRVKVEMLERIFCEKFASQMGRNRVESLERLTEKFILANLTLFNENVQDLPVSILENIANNFSDILPSQLIAPETRKIFIKISPNNSQESVFELFSIVTTKCKKLNDLRIDAKKCTFDILSKEFLDLIGSSLHSVERLELISCHINDNLISIVANACSLTLRHLDIRDNFNISPVGLLRLVSSCKNLQVLKFSQMFPPETLSEALSLLPNLREISLNYYGVHMDAISQIRVPLRLESMSFTACTPEFMERALHVLPYLKSIEIDNCTDLKPLQDYNLSNITSLTFTNLDQQFFKIIENASSLTSLKLFDCAGVDIATIGHVCLGLEHLTLNTPLVKSNLKLDERHFKKLKSFNFRNVQSDKCTLLHVLTRPELQFFKIENSVSILVFLNEQDVVFPSLTEFHLSGPLITTELILELIFRAPNVSAFSVDRCLTTSEHVALKIIIQKHFPLIKTNL